MAPTNARNELGVPLSIFAFVGALLKVEILWSTYKLVPQGGTRLWTPQTKAKIRTDWKSAVLQVRRPALRFGLFRYRE